MVDHLPHPSGRLAWWLSAWIRGDATPDEVQSGVLADDAAHHVAGLPDGPEPRSLLLSLGALRRTGMRSAGLAFPAPGHPVGLRGPSTFNAAALEAGEAVVLDGGGLGLVPHRAGAGVVWQAYDAARRPLVDTGEADRALRSAVTEAAGALAELEVARWRPEVADQLMNLRHVPVYRAPAGTPPAVVALAGRADQALAIVELALADDGGAVSAHEASQRADALRPLEQAGRVALVAACSPDAWPPA